ncbi:integrase, catalytic region, zinc finger, CCHC-type containing protein, partial [Tanacetum coccineum]
LRLRDFLKKFIGTVRFGNDHFGAIMGYKDYVIDLEVTFCKHSCYVRDVNGVDLIKENHGSNLYNISVEDMIKSSPICLLSKASKNKSWLWHHRLNHLNFGTINDLARKDLVRGLPRLKFEKDHLCSAFLKTPQQNDVVERWNRTLVGAARTMLIFSKAPTFLWAEVPILEFSSVMHQIGKGYRIYNKRTRRIIETIHVQFDELSEPLSRVHISTRPEPLLLTLRQSSSGLIPDHIPAAPYVPPTNKDLKIFFQLMFDEYFEPLSVKQPVPPAPAVPVLVVSAGIPSSTTIDQDAPSTSYSPSSSVV